MLKVFALPGKTRIAEWTAERVNYKLSLALWSARCENLKLGWRIESWVLFYRGFTNLGFFCSNGGKIREKVNSEAICKCDNI